MARDVFSEPFDARAWNEVVFGPQVPLEPVSDHPFEAPWGSGERHIVAPAQDDEIIVFTPQQMLAAAVDPMPPNPSDFPPR